MPKQDVKTGNATPGWLIKTVRGIVFSVLARGFNTKEEVIEVLGAMIEEVEKIG